MKLLWISPYAPYDKVAHGGGQNHNHYLKYLKQHTDFDITLVTVCDREELQDLDLDRYGIDHICEVRNRKSPKVILQTAVGRAVVFRDGDVLNNARYHLLLNGIRKYAARGEQPNVVLIQWAEAAVMMDRIRPLFPKAYYVMIEEDVAFLGYERKYEAAKKNGRNPAYTAFRKLKLDALKRAELKAIHASDLVAVLNEKDRKLLLDEGIAPQKLLKLCSYHGFYADAVYAPDPYQLLFYGAMARPENYRSALWFIENVLPLLDRKYRLVVVGSHPTQELLSKESDRVHVTGFVEKIQPYFEQSLCLCASLLLGAGIKIKVLEALSAGLPVVTGKIGAEGIGLEDDVSYLHCETAEEYAAAIRRLTEDAALRARLSENGRKLVEEQFDADRALDRLIAVLKDINRDRAENIR